MKWDVRGSVLSRIVFYLHLSRRKALFCCIKAQPDERIIVMHVIILFVCYVLEHFSSNVILQMTFCNK